jgi:hypothetical protein
VTIQGYSYENKLFVTSPDTNWKNVPEMRVGEAPGAFMERMVRQVTAPAHQIEELTKRIGDNLRKQGDTYSGDLLEAHAKALVEDRKSRTLEDGPQVKSATGSVKFWTKDGAVTKYELTLRGKKSVDGVLCYTGQEY